MIESIALTDKNRWTVKYAEDIYLELYPPSVRSIELNDQMIVEYELMWFDVKCYANILKIINYEPLSLLPVNGTSR